MATIPEDPRIVRIENKIDSLFKLRTDDHTNIALLIDNMSGMDARLGVLELSDREQQAIIHRGEGIKWAVHIVGALFTSLVSGLAVYFLMR